MQLREIILHFGLIEDLERMHPSDSHNNKKIFPCRYSGCGFLGKAFIQRKTLEKSLETNKISLHMRRTAHVTLILLFSSVSLIAQEHDFIKEYLERLENSKTYLKLVAEAMPGEKYGFRATPESMSFEENLMHIGWAMDWHSQSLMGGRKARDWDTDTELKVDGKSKKEMIAKISETFDTTITFIANFDADRLAERLDYFGADRTKRQILLLLADHITHHRAQMLVHLRLNGIKPPRYVLYQ